MAEKKDIQTFFKSLPTATSPDARWGLGGIITGFILFAIPLALYFFERGGILMLPSWAWITFGVVVTLVWIYVAVASTMLFWRWWKTTDHKNAITVTEIRGFIKLGTEILEQNAEVLKQNAEILKRLEAQSVSKNSTTTK